MSNSHMSLPQGWIWATIGDICFPPQYGWTTKALESGSLHLLRTTDITSGYIDWKIVPYCQENPPEKEKYLLNDGDIVISRAGSVGFSYLIKNPPESVFASYLIRFKPLVNGPYLAYFLMSPSYWHSISEKSIGIALANVNASKLKQILLPLPPLHEQHRIVTKIEELFTQLDAGIASLKKVQEQLKRYRQAVLKAAFDGRLTREWREEHKGEIEPADVLRDKIVESQQKWIKGKSKNIDNVDPKQFAKIPEEWIWTRIHNIAPVIQYGSSEKADDDTTGIPIIRMGNLQDGKIDFSKLKYISKKSLEVVKCLLHRGDVLFNRTNSAELVGKTAVFNKESFEAVFASYLIRMRVDDDLYSPEFLSYYINSAFGRSYISSVVSQQVGQANVNGTKLANMPIPYPHISEQKNIVSEIERHFSQIDHLEQIITTSLHQANTLRQSILKRAFEGKLVPQDLNDEPASILLERIKAEKSRYAAESKKGNTLQAKSPKRKIKNAN